MAQHFQPPPGTRDFYPEQMAVRRYIEDTWRRVSQRHGFVEVDGPTFEYLDLYKVKSGEEIVSQLFHFESRGEDKTEFALRPEFTPTLARMVAAKANSLPRPIKWFSIPRCYRAERPQKGRLREFMQWNVDMLSEPVANLRAARECMALCIAAIKEFGFTAADIKLVWNNRTLMNRALVENGFAGEQVAAVFSLIDKMPRLDAEQRRRLYAEQGIREAQQVMLERIASGEMPQTESTAALLAEAGREMEEVGIAEFCRFDPRIVRGLAYYTGFVFEVMDATGSNRAVAGGGQYDQLIETFGGPSLRAAGFGMGDVVLEILLREKRRLPASLGARMDVFVIAMDALLETEAQKVLAELRESLWNEQRTEIIRAGLSAIASYKATKNIGKLLQEAAGSGARVAVILAPAEWERGMVKIKNMATREEKEVLRAEVVAAVRGMLA